MKESYEDHELPGGDEIVAAISFLDDLKENGVSRYLDSANDPRVA